MDPQALASAAEKWKQVLGPEHVLTDETALRRYTRNISGLHREVPAALRPGTTEQVQQVVRIANAYRTPLHPISTGRNWGLGSALPPRDNTCILDLSRMNRVREVNARHHFAVVEAGVTQGQLYRHLSEQGLPLMLNVTGAGCDTSLIGNALERGIGYFSSRAESLAGLEVVLGNGEMLRTGFGHYPQSRTTYHYRFGVGPSFDGLFAQSNFGIVTSAGVDLLPVTGGHMAVVCSIDDPTSLGEFVEAFADLRRSGVIRTVVHIGNAHRTRVALGAVAESGETSHLLGRHGFGAWSAVGGLMGSAAELRLVRKAIRKRLHGLAKPTFITQARLHLAQVVLGLFSFVPRVKESLGILRGIEAHHGLSMGMPTDEPLKSLYWSAHRDLPEGPMDPDADGCGMLYCLPFFPLDGAVAQRQMTLVENVLSKYGFTPYITLNIVDTKVLEGVVNVSFDATDSDQAEKANACIREYQSLLISEGMMPYRVGIQFMDQVLDKDDSFWRVVAALKQTFDPNGIISPGRYNLI